MQETDTHLPVNETADHHDAPFDMRKAAIAAVTAAGLTMTGVATVEHVRSSEFNTPVYETTIHDTGNGLIAAINTEVEQYFSTNNLDLAKIPVGPINEAGIKADREHREETGQPIQPTDTFSLSLKQNEYGDYTVVVDEATPPEALPDAAVELPTPETH